MHATRLVLTLALALCAAACGSKKEPGRDAAQVAVTKLQKIQAATQVGVNQITYGPLLIDAKSEVNQATDKLVDASLKVELNAAMDAYVDAAGAWSGEFFIDVESAPGSVWKIKYSVPEKKRDWGERKPYLDRDNLVQIMWASADKHLQEATNRIKTLE